MRITTALATLSAVAFLAAQPWDPDAAWYPFLGNLHAHTGSPREPMQDVAARAYALRLRPRNRLVAPCSVSSGWAFTVQVAVATDIRRTLTTDRCAIRRIAAGVLGG